MWAELLTSILGGGATGLIGTAISAVTNYKTQKLKNSHELAMVKAETDAMIKEAEANIKIEEAKVRGEIAVTEAKITGEIELAEMDAFKRSIEIGNLSLTKESWISTMLKSKYLAWLAAIIVFSMGMIDVLRGLARPLITYYMIAIASWLTYVFWQILSETGMNLTPNDILPIMKQIINTVLYLTTLVVSWWFGSRHIEKHTKGIK